MNLEIRTTIGQIGIDRRPSSLEMQSQAAQVELSKTKPNFSMHTEPTRIKIDQYEARASAGLKNDADLIREWAQKGKQQAIETIGKIAEDGNRLAAIQYGGNPIAEMAKRDSTTTHEFGIDYLPKTGPVFDVTGSVDISCDWSDAGVHSGVEAQYTPGNLNMNYTPAQIEINVKQYGSVDINYVGNNVDIGV